MPPRDKISQLPAEVRTAIDRLLIDRGFSGYEALEEQILEAHGIEVGKSTLHRYGQRLERRLSAIKASTEAAKAIADAAPDEADQRSAAVISLVQSDLFEALLDLQEAGDEEVDTSERVKLLSRAARAIAQTGRASVSQKKWAAEIRREAATEAAEVASAAMASQGMSREAIATIKRDILGIA